MALQFNQANLDVFSGSLVSGYNLDETSGSRIDDIGSDDLTDVNSVGFSASGKNGNAADFIRANSECLSLGSGITDTSGDFVVAFWFKADDNTSGFIHAQYDLPGGFDAITVNWSGGTLTAFSFDSGAVIVDKSGLSTGIFHHVSVIRDGSTLFLFVNGIQEDSAATGTLRLADNFRIGCRDFGSGNTTFFDGLVDAFYLWNAQSFGGGNPSKEKFGRGLFNLGLGRFLTTAVTPLRFNNATLDEFAGSLGRYWDLNETSGTRADTVSIQNLTDINSVGFAAGKDGNAADFVRANSTALESDFPGTDTRVDFAHSVWFLADDNTTGYFYSEYNSNAEAGIAYRWGSGTLDVIITDSVGEKINSKTGLSTGVFHHVVAIFVGSTWQLYFNGVLENSQGVTTPLKIGEHVRFGCRDVGAGNVDHFDGLVDAFVRWEEPAFGGPNPTRAQFASELFNGGVGLFLEPLIASMILRVQRDWRGFRESKLAVKRDLKGTEHSTKLSVLRDIRSQRNATLTALRSWKGTEFRSVLTVKRDLRSFHNSKLSTSRDMRANRESTLTVRRDLQGVPCRTILSVLRDIRAGQSAVLSVRRDSRANQRVILAVQRDLRILHSSILSVQRDVRAIRDGVLTIRRTLRGGRESTLTFSREVYTKFVYEIWDVTTNTFLGAIDGDAVPLELDVVLADGDHQIEVRAAEWQWPAAHTAIDPDSGPGTRLAQNLFLTMTGGALDAALPPPIDGLTFSDVGEGFLIRWQWVEAFGSATPTEFALWFSAITPVVITGSPDALVSARDPGFYQFLFVPPQADRFVAVAARRVTEPGPVTLTGPQSEIPLPFAGLALSSPADQYAEETE